MTENVETSPEDEERTVSISDDQLPEDLRPENDIEPKASVGEEADINPPEDPLPEG